jgi:hypothetical protein
MRHTNPRNSISFDVRDSRIRLDLRGRIEPKLKARRGSATPPPRGPGWARPPLPARGKPLKTFRYPAVTPITCRINSLNDSGGLSASATDYLSGDLTTAVTIPWTRCSAATTNLALLFIVADGIWMGIANFSKSNFILLSRFAKRGASCDMHCPSYSPAQLWSFHLQLRVQLLQRLVVTAYVLGGFWAEIWSMMLLDGTTERCSCAV